MTHSGRYRYGDEAAGEALSGSCRLDLDEDSFTLTPERGASLLFDYGDVDAFLPDDYQLSLRLYAGRSLLLSHFGKAHQNLCHDFLEAYRNRLVKCLLLDDLKEIERFDGFVQLDSVERSFSGPAELRLYKSNLAVLFESAAGLQWRLADIDAVDFDEPTYTLGIRSGADRLILTRLAKRTREFIERLQSAMDGLSTASAGILQSLFPFLAGDRFRQTAELMKEGRAVPSSKLAAIDPRIPGALMAKTVSPRLAPYLDLLKEKAMDQVFAGFKLIRPDSEEDEPSESEPHADNFRIGEAGADEEAVLHWMVFPLKSSRGRTSLAAWETVSHSGRATYVFRLFPQDQAGYSQATAALPELIERAVQRLNRALVLLNFKREPIYLPDETLEMNARYRRYAIARRKMSVLRQLRSSYLGRALHTSPENWQEQMRAIVSKED